MGFRAVAAARANIAAHMAAAAAAEDAVAAFQSVMAPEQFIPMEDFDYSLGSSKKVSSKKVNTESTGLVQDCTLTAPYSTDMSMASMLSSAQSMYDSQFDTGSITPSSDVSPIIPDPSPIADSDRCFICWPPILHMSLMTYCFLAHVV